VREVAGEFYQIFAVEKPYYLLEYNYERVLYKDGTPVSAVSYPPISSTTFELRLLIISRTAQQVL
jgi:hypothetical protein